MESSINAQLELPAMKLNPEPQETAVSVEVNEQATGSVKIINMTQYCGLSQAC